MVQTQTLSEQLSGQKSGVNFFFFFFWPMKIKNNKNIGVRIWCPFLVGESGKVKKEKKEKKGAKSKD